MEKNGSSAKQLQTIYGQRYSLQEMVWEQFLASPTAARHFLLEDS